MVAKMSEEQCGFCGVCRYNHDQGRKHVYNKSHQQKVSAIVKKFSEKVVTLCGKVVRKIHTVLTQCTASECVTM